MELQTVGPGGRLRRPATNEQHQKRESPMIDGLSRSCSFSLVVPPKAAASAFRSSVLATGTTRRRVHRRIRRRAPLGVGEGAGDHFARTEVHGSDQRTVGAGGPGLVPQAVGRQGLADVVELGAHGVRVEDFLVKVFAHGQLPVSIGFEARDRSAAGLADPPPFCGCASPARFRANSTAAICVTVRIRWVRSTRPNTTGSPVRAWCTAFDCRADGRSGIETAGYAVLQ